MNIGIHAGTNVEQTRTYNRRAVLQAIRLGGPISRPELADLTGLTAQTVSIITRELIETDLIEIAGRRQGRRGHPAVELQINPSGAFAIGVSLDQDRIVILLVDLQGNIHHRLSLKTDFPPPETALPLIAERITQMAATDPERAGKLLGIGMAVPGRLSLNHELVIPPSRLQAWNQVPIVSHLSAATGLPVILENDANAAAVGESLYGVSRGFQNFVYVFLGAGLGCGIMTNGFPYRGTTGFAGEFGLFPTDGGNPAGQGFSGLSDHVSLFQLCARLKARGYGAVRPEDLQELCESADPCVEEWLDEASSLLFQPIQALQCLLDPQAILFGGPAPSILIDALLTRLEIRLSEMTENRLIAPKLMRATSGEDAAALGAAVLPVYDALSAHPDAFLNRAVGRAAPLGSGSFFS